VTFIPPFPWSLLTIPFNRGLAATGYRAYCVARTNLRRRPKGLVALRRFWRFALEIRCGCFVLRVLPLRTWILLLHQPQQTLHQRQRCRRASGDDNIHRNHVRHRAATGVSHAELAATNRTIASRDYPFWIRCRFVSAQQRRLHMPRHRTCNQQNVGMPGRCDKMNAEALDVIIWVV
jgi:hypothetical protein